MKKVRVIVKTINSHHQIFVEHNGERTLYAVTDKLSKAKDLVLKAKRELGIARGSRALFPAPSGKKNPTSHATLSGSDLCSGQARRLTYGPSLGRPQLA